MATSPVMRLLADGVPITLLCDLTTTRAPESEAINLSERPAGDELYAEAVLLIANSARTRAATG